MMVILQKMILKKLFTSFYVTPSCFSSICFVIIPFTPKLVKCFTSVLLFTIYFATQQIAVTIEIMIDFLCRLSDKAKKSISYLYTCTYLTARVTTPIISNFPFNRV